MPTAVRSAEVAATREPPKLALEESEQSRDLALGGGAFERRVQASARGIPQTFHPSGRGGDAAQVAYVQRLQSTLGNRGVQQYLNHRAAENRLGASNAPAVDLPPVHGPGPEVTSSFEGEPAGSPLGEAAQQSVVTATPPRGDTRIPGEDRNAKAVDQARRVRLDSQRSEAEVTKSAGASRLQVTRFLGGLRSRFSGFFAQASAGVQQFIASKQAELSAAAEGATRAAQEFVTNTKSTAEAQANRVRQGIDSVVQGIVSSLQGRVQGFANQITGVLNRFPLPDIPGVAQVRSFATGILQRAAGAVTSGLSRVQGLIQSALSAGMNLVRSMLDVFQRLASGVISQANAAIQGLIRTAGQVLNRAAQAVIAAVRGIYNRTVAPMISTLEQKILNAIGKAQGDAISAIRKNRDEHLQALSPNAGATAGKESAAAGGDDGGTDDLAQSAIQNNQKIVETFRTRSAAVIGSVIERISASASQIIDNVSHAVAQIRDLIGSKIREVVQGFSRIVQAVTNFIQSVVQELTAALGKVIAFVRGLVENPVDQLVQFAQGVLNSMIGFMRRIIDQIVSVITGSRPAEQTGQFSPTPALAPAPAFLGPALPIAVAILTAIVGAIGGAVYLIGGTVMIIIGGSVYFVSATVVIVVVAVVALLLLLLLLYLLYRLLKPRKPPKKPPRKPVPVTIGGGTELWHFGGEKPPAYPLEQTLTANAGGLPGVFTWTLPKGRLFADFNGTGIAVGPTVLLKSKLGSTSVNNIEVKVEFAGAGGETGTAVAQFTVLRPDKMTFLRNVDNTDATFAYMTEVHYSIQDQFRATMPRVVPINEQFTAPPTADFPGMNWRRGNPGGATVNPNDWFDKIQGETATHTPTPVGPTHPQAGVRVYHWPGTWQVGSLVIGKGRTVLSVIWRKFRGRARHI